MSVYLIAEAGACHDGNYYQARQLISEAARCGANACKFQWTSSAEKLAARRNAPDYLDAYRVIQFPEEWHGLLADACREVGLDYMCTVYLPEDIAVIAPYVAKFKIASFEAQDGQFIRAHQKLGKPVLASIGMYAEPPVMPAWIYWLQCTSAYPTPLAEMNLAVIREYGLDGLSDHSGDVGMGALAVAAGARIIETHIKLPTTNPANLDAGPHALLPEDYALYVQHARFAETIMGDGVKKIQPSEAPMTRYLVR